MRDQFGLELQRCEDEPIRVPGSVQQHGFFLLIDPQQQSVLVASENAERFLQQPLKLILGARLDAILGRELRLSLESIRHQKNRESYASVTYLGTFRIGDDQFDVVTHPIGALRALEFERQERLTGTEVMNSVITNFVATLGGLQNSQDLYDALTEQIAELTGFDRTMLYSFNDEGHGTVLSEVNSGRLPSYLGLRFPGSDIPRQARELYILNTTRIIPDADYIPSPLAGSTTRLASQLDLSLSVLRSVSPIHLQYMQNMRTAASMSVSIVLEGKLWGLISCHNSAPRTVPYLVRSACDMLAKLASTKLTSFRATARVQEMVQFHNAQRDLLTMLAGQQDYLLALLGQTRGLLRITNASGVAVLSDDRLVREGQVPDEEHIRRLGAWLDANDSIGIFESSQLSHELPWTDEIREPASGLLAIRISSVQGRYVMWFRPQLVSTVTWAGDPVKQEAEAKHLTPRASFEQWTEIVKGRSVPWTEMEVESATGFRAALTSIGLRRAEEELELGEARFQQLTQALPMRIFVADGAGELTYVNLRWLESGLSATGLWFEQLRLSPKDVENSKSQWQECIMTGNSFEGEMCLASPVGGQDRYYFARVAPFQRPGATRAGWIGTLVDLTESKEREAALRITEKLALTGRMTSVIAHEINNPLEAITNLMFLLRGEMKQNATATGYIGLAESELERISGITKQTLRWNRESGDQAASLDLNQLVDDVLRLFTGKIRNRQIKMMRERSLMVECWGVIGQIRQVMANLVSNAIDATPVGGTISIKLQQQDEQAAFVVQDSGIGMSAAMQVRLFEPFFSTKGDLGNGLGLYISREIVERHLGKIVVVSELGRGTTMTVWLPTGSPTLAPSVEGNLTFA